ncbi:MAG: DUF87 domain-containing protein [Gammaproteobacteria bacterium]|nr:DUF87 domain-containing protein [Gammaproteobacteria bacterium]
MKKQKHPIPDLALDADIAILGKKGRGKTYTAKGIVENLLAMGRRVVILDPLNVWWGLRADASGRKAGFPIAVFGGSRGDLPLTESMARPLARLIAHNNLPAVIDMSDMRKGQWQRLVCDMLDELFTENRDPLWIVLEEADIFAPQQPREGDSAAVLGEVDRIARRGRAFGFRLISLTQRPARLHKDVLTQLSSLVALGVTSPQDREAIKSWVDGNADRDAAKEVISSLAKLEVGEGWLWVPDFDVLKRVRFPRIQTLDTSSTPKAGEKRIEAKKLADVDLSEIQDALAADVPEENSVKVKHQTAADVKRLKAEAYKKGYEDGIREGRSAERERIALALQKIIKPLKEDVVNDNHRAQKGLKKTLDTTAEINPLSPSAEKILNVIVGIWPNVLRYSVAATRAGISKRSSAYRSYRKELLNAGLAIETERGIEPAGGAMEQAGPMPQGLDDWIHKLPKSQSKMLQVLIAHNDWIDRDDLGVEAGISLRSSGLLSGIRNLNGLGLVDIDGRKIRISVNLDI